MRKHKQALDELARLGGEARSLPAIFRADSTPSNQDIKNLIEEGNRAYKAFQENVENRLQEIEKNGQPTAETEQKLARANEDIQNVLDRVSEIESQKERIDDLEARIQRGDLSGGGNGTSYTDAQVAQFNAMLADGRGREPGLDAQAVSRYKDALIEMARRGDKAVSQEVRNELSVGVDPEGGYWVTPDMDGRMVELIYETSDVRQEASIQMIGTDSLQGTYDLDEAGYGWVGEQDSRSETDTPTIGEWEIFANEMYAMPIATQKLLDDASVDVEAWLTDKIRRRFVRAENDAFVNGNGVKKPRGFLTYTTNTSAPTSSNYQRIQKVKTGASGDFNGTDPANVFLDAQGKLKTAYRGSAVWAMNRSTIAETMKLQDGQGQYLLVPDFQSGRRTLLGHPIREWDDMPDLGASSLSIAFGDFGSGYQIVDRVGMRLLRDPYTTKGKVKFYATRRVGGAVVDFDAIKLIEFAS